MIWLKPIRRAKLAAGQAVVFTKRGGQQAIVKNNGKSLGLEGELPPPLVSVLEKALYRLRFIREKNHCSLISCTEGIRQLVTHEAMF